MIKELNLSRSEIEESLKKALYNNHMATYLLLSRTGGPYNNNRIPEVLNQFRTAQTTQKIKQKIGNTRHFSYLLDLIIQ